METINFAIVGLGVIGGSIAKALGQQSEFDVRVLGIDIDAGTIEKALEDGVIDYGETINRQILQESDIVYITLYPSDLVDFVKEHKNDFKPGAILTDATGVKGDLIASVKEVLPDNVDFIFGHPMAGKENKGYHYADGDIFDQANYLITPTEDNAPENIDLLQKILKAIGFKRISQVTPQDHDEMIAYTSQLCHVIAVALMNSDDPDRETVRFVGDSFRELTRISKINSQLWSDLFIHNKDYLLDVMNEFNQEFMNLRKAIADDDYESLVDMFNESTARRIALEQDDNKLRSNLDIEDIEE